MRNLSEYRTLGKVPFNNPVVIMTHVSLYKRQHINGKLQHLELEWYELIL